MAIAVETWRDRNSGSRPKISELHRPEDDTLNALVYDLQVAGLFTRRVSLLPLLPDSASEDFVDFVKNERRFLISDCLKNQQYFDQIRQDPDLSAYHNRAVLWGYDPDYAQDLNNRAARYLPDEVLSIGSGDERVAIVTKISRQFARHITSERGFIIGTSETLEEMGLDREAAALNNVLEIYDGEIYLPCFYIADQSLAVASGL